jgi:limonene-1,2-epoxide hydrolase
VTAVEDAYPGLVVEMEPTMENRKGSGDGTGAAIEGPVAVVAAFVGAWERNDPDEIVGLFAEDAVWFDGYPANPFNGADQIRAQLERYSRHLSDISIEIVHEAVDGDVVFQERVDRGLRDGKPFAVEAVCVFTVRGGKIVENRDYWNPAAYMRRSDDKSV